MQVIQDNLWICVDCLQAAVNDDYTGLDYAYNNPDEVAKRIQAGLESLGPNLVPNFDSETSEGIKEFSSVGCACCGSSLVGNMHRFAILR